MRRLVIEVSQKEYAKFEAEEGFEKVKTLEILHFLRYDQEEVAFICRIEFNDSSATIEEVFQEKDTKIQLLDQEKNGAQIYFVKGKPPKNEQGHRTLNGYVSTFEIRERKIRMGIVGDDPQIKSFFNDLKKSGVHYRALLLTDAKFSPESPLSRLTEKQRQAIVSAYEYGYFDAPRKISSEQLAKKLGLVKSTLTVHLRRAEHRLLAEMLNG